MTSLTAPWDRNEDEQLPKRNTSTLTDEQTEHAVKELLDSKLLEKFPRTDKLYADPIYNNQMYCLHSFVPTKGASPDEHGVFGFIKFRGAFQNIEEANQRAEFIIRNVDSYHGIQTGYCGRPFPVCLDTKKFVNETHEVDIRKQAIQTISEDIKAKRLKEKRDIDDIKEREQNLLDHSKSVQDDTYEEDPTERYTMLQVKKAQLIFTYIKTKEKMLQMQDSIKSAYKEIKEMDGEDDKYKNEYFERYTKAREAAGIKDETDDNFVKYMGEDVELDFDYL